MASQSSAPPQAVSVTYDLHDLPTAQHKAGLAGLLLQIDSMKKRDLPEDDIPEVEFTSTSARVRFTPASLQGLFDDLYDAEVVEVRVPNRWQGEPPKREEPFEETDPRTGKIRKGKRFVYDEDQLRVLIRIGVAVPANGLVEVRLVALEYLFGVVELVLGPADLARSGVFQR